MTPADSSWTTQAETGLDNRAPTHHQRSSLGAGPLREAHIVLGCQFDRGYLPPHAPASLQYYLLLGLASQILNNTDETNALDTIEPVDSKLPLSNSILETFTHPFDKCETIVSM